MKNNKEKINAATKAHSCVVIQKIFNLGKNTFQVIGFKDRHGLGFKPLIDLDVAYSVSFVDHVAANFFSLSNPLARKKMLALRATGFH